MKSLLALSLAAMALLLPIASSAQPGHMTNGGWMAGYGGMWTPILLVIVVAALVAWVVKRSGK